MKRKINKLFDKHLHSRVRTFRGKSGGSREKEFVEIKRNRGSILSSHGEQAISHYWRMSWIFYAKDSSLTILISSVASCGLVLDLEASSNPSWG
jgi:hypothetical protein